MKKLLAALAALLISSHALATTYYVNPSSVPSNGAGAGNNSNNGTSTSSPWRDIDKANTTMVSGDKVYLLPGTYAYFPRPTGSPTGGTRFTYIGAGPVGSGKDPLTDSLTRFSIAITATAGNSYQTKNYVTVKGLRFVNGMGFDSTATRDSVVRCQIEDSDTHLLIDGADDITFDKNTFNVTHVNLNRINSVNSGGPTSKRLVFTNNDFWRLGVGWTCCQHIWVTTAIDSCTFRFNRRFFTTDPNLQSSFGTEWHLCEENSTYYSNYTVINLGSQQYAAWRWRGDNGHTGSAANLGGCHDISIKRDTLVAYGSGGGSFFPSSSATCDGTATGCIGMWNVTMDSCLVNASGCGGTTDWNYQGGLWSWSCSYTTIAMNGSAIRAFDLKGHNTFNHCTLAGMPSNVNGAKAAIEISDEYNRPALGDTSFTLTNSIIYRFDNPGGSGDVNSTNAAIGYARAKIDSAGKMHLQKKVLANRNLYSYAGYATTPGDRSIAVYGNGPFIRSTPGDSTAANPQGRAENRYNIDSLSVAGDPLFTNGARSATFNAKPRAGSPAIGIGTSGSDAGAVASSPYIDVTPSPLQIDFSHDQSDTAVINLWESTNTAVQTDFSDSYPNSGPPITTLDADGTPISGNLTPVANCPECCITVRDFADEPNFTGAHKLLVFYDGKCPKPKTPPSGVPFGVVVLVEPNSGPAPIKRIYVPIYIH